VSGDKKELLSRFLEMEESEMEVEEDKSADPLVKQVFGSKLARSLVCSDWRFKEMGLKQIYKQVSGWLDHQSRDDEDSTLIHQRVQATITAVGLTCKDKVIKVFTVSVQLFSLLINSPRLIGLKQDSDSSKSAALRDRSGLVETLKNQIVDSNIVLKLL
jgi:hypothetical protein